MKQGEFLEPTQWLDGRRVVKFIQGSHRGMAYRSGKYAGGIVQACDAFRDAGGTGSVRSNFVTCHVSVVDDTACFAEGFRRPAIEYLSSVASAKEEGRPSPFGCGRFDQLKAPSLSRGCRDRKCPG